MPDCVSNILLIFTSVQSKCFYVYFTDKETDSEHFKVTFPRSQLRINGTEFQRWSDWFQGLCSSPYGCKGHMCPSPPAPPPVGPEAAKV